ncbi:hypothetical protein FE257_003586 [Aspergillus nanangensis]|uniref:C2H2-type domain-containing protein n=1 Tax=Aspergillus nanangensis TaxID=2582783 RepID=A0AAD4CRW3_ASPNN|nr:hypothetical protein FE257_003586 [Aspergillus nanangensis]
MSQTNRRDGRRRRKTSQGERICSICSQAFKKAEHLARHYRSHTKERPFMCEICGKFYARQDTLLRHSRLCHVNTEPAERRLMEDRTQPEQPLMTSKTDQFLHPSQHDARELEDLPGDNLELPTNCYSFPDAMPTGRDHRSSDHVDPSTAHFIPTAVEYSDRIESPVIIDHGLESDWISWLTGTDFDVDAMNQSLLESAAPGISPTVAESCGSRAPIQRHWHTFCETITSSNPTPDGTSVGNLDSSHLQAFTDEAYRQKLAESLQQHVQPGTLPSTAFLDLCIQAYFAQYHTIFPLVHMPTFQSSKKNPVLLLSICSIGTLFLASPGAIAHGISMFERLQKAILASWDTHIYAAGDLSIIALQASLIGQTFGLLLGRPKDLTGIEIFHGSVIAWARKAKLFGQSRNSTAEITTFEDNSPELDAAWKTWVRDEERKRIVIGIHILDIELAKLYHHEPILRHSIEKLPELSPADVFAAPNATAWRRQLMAPPALAHAPPSPEDTASESLSSEIKATNPFQSYCVLESIGAMMYEDRDTTATWPTTVQICHNLLVQWHHNNFPVTLRHDHHTSNIDDSFCLRILWHSTFMHLYTDFDDLERACGREGEGISAKSIAYATSWARSLDAKRTLLHAGLVQRLFQSIAIGEEAAIHVPMALYYCGIAWASFTQFGLNTIPTVSPNEDTPDRLDFSELTLLGINQTELFNEVTRGITLGRSNSRPLFHIIDLLSKVSHWKVSQSFATTLLSLVKDIPDLL